MSKVLSSLLSLSSLPTEATRPLRVYESLWLKLRSDGKVIISVEAVSIIPRLKRMISKEKDMDLGFKLINEGRSFLKFDWNCRKKELTVLLLKQFSLIDLL